MYIEATENISSSKKWKKNAECLGANLEMAPSGLNFSLDNVHLLSFALVYHYVLKESCQFKNPLGLTWFELDWSTNNEQNGAKICSPIQLTRARTILQKKNI